jgi:hypothetical protein
MAPRQRYSDFGMEIPMRQSEKTFDSSQLEYDAWRDLFRSKSGRYYSEAIKPSAFTGWVRPVSVRGFTALDIGCNAQRVERTYRGVRLDGAGHYFAVFQVDGQLATTHNDQAVRLAAGDVALVDAALPVTYSVWIVLEYLVPSPPSSVTIATGPKGTTFDYFGERYRARFARGNRTECPSDCWRVRKFQAFARSQVIAVGIGHRFADGPVYSVFEIL